MPCYLASTPHTAIRRSAPADADEFTSLVLASQSHLHPWVSPATTPEKFLAHLATRDQLHNDGFLLCCPSTHAIKGVVNLNNIVRGSFQSAYLGYFSLAPRQGHLLAGLRLVIQYAFTELKLHRLEANIQPANTASISLVQKFGFQKEGFSPKYLHIAGEWRDHERYAILAEDFLDRVTDPDAGYT